MNEKIGFEVRSSSVHFTSHRVREYEVRFRKQIVRKQVSEHFGSVKGLCVRKVWVSDQVRKQVCETITGNFKAFFRCPEHFVEMCTECDVTHHT